MPLLRAVSACLTACVCVQLVKPEFVFRVMPAYYELAPKVAAAINQGINVGRSE